MAHKGRSGFGFKIDYDRAIADDERMIAKLTDPALIAASATMTDAEWVTYEEHRVDVIWWAALDPARTAERLAIVGLTLKEAHDLLFATYNDDVNADDMLRAAFGAVDVNAASYRNGEDLGKRFEEFHRDLHRPAKRAEHLKAYKARLARHRRNKAKYAP